MPRQIVYEGRKIKVAIDTETLPNGETIRRDVILHPGAVVILPILDTEHVCLLRNHRFVIGETLWEVPAGTLEPGEKIEVCAERELNEETGYRAGRMHYFGYFYASPGVMSEKLHLFFAMDLTPGPMALEVCEQIEPHTVPLRQAIEMSLNREIIDAKSITALLLWERLGPQILANPSTK